jgi:hypothetical protein
VKATEIIEALLYKLATPVGRQLYGVLGTYRGLDAFSHKLRQAKTPDGFPFPEPLNVNQGVLQAMPDDEFRDLAENEAKRPAPIAAQVAKAFERFLRANFTGKGVLVLAHIEMLFAYRVDFHILRALAADRDRALLLLPGRRSGDRIILFHETPEEERAMPKDLIVAGHLWEVAE